MKRETRWATEQECMEAFGVKDEAVQHCSSCHTDAEGGHPMASEIELPDGRIAEVCCGVSNAIPPTAVEKAPRAT